MKSILEEFANDNILPGSRYFKQNSEYGKAIKKAADLEDTLGGLLNENERKLLDEFSSAQAEVSRLSSVDKFIYGYRLGVLMTMEVFTGRDDLVVGGEAG